MNLRTRILAAATAALVVTLACNDNPFLPGSYEVSDRWTGTAYQRSGTDSVPYRFDLSLEQDHNDITGSGVVMSPTDTFPVEVVGRWEYPSVDLVLHSDDTAPLGFDGQFDVDTLPRPAPDTLRDVVTRSDSILGTLNGSGFTTIPLALGRATDPS